MHSQMTTVLAN